MADLVEEVKNRLSIVDVVSQYVQLKKAGKNYKGLCPFHDEKTPSFIVSPERQICWCFGCQKGGDIFSFVQTLENIDFVESVNLLAERANIDVAKYRNQGNRGVSKGEKDHLFRIYEVAMEFFVDRLMNSGEGAGALNYLVSRGISREMVEKFNVGWSPEGFQELFAHLLEKGFSKEEVVKSGLVISKDTTASKVFDRFHGRIIFPIRDSLGRIVAFGGRILQADREPKYLNSAESLIYNKRSVLYGFSDAKKAIKDLDQVVIVEGYLDVIASVQVGVENVVATSGTALTTQHIQLLKRMTDNLIFAFDSDRAGLDAARRGVEVALPFDVNVRILRIDEGKDAADLLKDGSADWKSIVNEARPYLDFFLDHYKREFSVDDPARIKKILERIFPLIRPLKSRVLLDQSIRSIAKELNLQPESLYSDFENFSLPLSHPVKMVDSSRDEHLAAKFDDYEHLLGLIVNFPETVHDLHQELMNVDFHGDLQNIYNNFWKHYNPSRLEFDKDNFFANISDDENKEINILTLYIEQKYREFSFDNIQNEVRNFILRIQRQRSHLTRQQLQEKLREAETTGDLALIQLLLEQIQKTY